MKTRGVFFDLYGTLLIYGDMRAAWWAWLEAYHSMLTGFGLEMSLEEFAVTCDGYFSRPVPPDGGHGLTPFELRLQAHAAELGLTLDSARMEAIGRRIIPTWQEYVPMDPEAVALLQSLQGVTYTALVSNFDHPPHIYDTLRDYGLTDYFRDIVISGEVGVSKPDPRIFESALANSGLDPREVAYIGDSDDDVRAAEAAGMIPVLIRRRVSADAEVSSDFRVDYDKHRKTDNGVSGDEVITIERLSDLPRCLAY